MKTGSIWLLFFMNRIMRSNAILSRSEQSFVSASIDYELCPATRNGNVGVIPYSD
jgi:hypothetical protein